MNNPSADPQKTRHCMLNWLALHGLDEETCLRILDAVQRSAANEPEPPAALDWGQQTLDLEVAWLRVLEAMRAFLPAQQSIIDDTFNKTEKIALSRPGKSRKALTLDNGPTAYPTIYYGYHDEPSDSLIIAHEFGHALQIRASAGTLVPPVIREICAFLGELALLSHTLHIDGSRYAHLAQAWREHDRKYYGQGARLRAALPQPDSPYNYSWNYPIARYLAFQIYEGCSREWIWSLYAGQFSVGDILSETSSRS